MATSATPYGFRPVGMIGGTPYAGAFRQIKIASGYGTNIFNGSVVGLTTAGVIEVVGTVGSAGSQFPAGVVGVFVGCSYTDPNTSQKTFSQRWPTGIVASDAVGFVIDDPNALFQVQSAGSIAQASLGENVALSGAQSTSTGSTTTGNSTTAVSASPAVTDGIAFRIVDFVNSPTSAVGDAFTDLLVKFNPVAHSYNNPTGK